jgi:tRNA A-37 threonylcarbamoyl transferase component Bud32
MKKNLVKKNKPMKNLKSGNFSKEMETFIDSQIDSTDYSAMRRKEYRMNEFIKKLTKFRTQKEENRITKLNKLAFKRPLNFYYPKENDHEDLHDNNNLSS